VGIKEPCSLTDLHIVEDFDCGEIVLNEWLKKRALKNQRNGASRTFVSCIDNRVIGYYALASGSVERLYVPKALSRNMPESIPVIILARLAVDKSIKGKKIGSALLKNAILKVLAVEKNIGVKALLVHAMSDSAKQFYCHYGFLESSLDPMILMLSIKAIKASFVDSD